MKSNIKVFGILKEFGISNKLNLARLWLSPPCVWMKCNIDGAAHGAPGLTACGTLFQDRAIAFEGCFTHSPLPFMQNFLVLFELLKLLLRKDDIVYELQVTLCWWFKLSPIITLFLGIFKISGRICCIGLGI